MPRPRFLRLAAPLLAAAVLAIARPAAAADARIAFIDSAKLFQQYRLAQEAQQRFDRQVQSWREEAAEKEKSVEALRKEVRDQAPILSSLRRQEREQALQNAIGEYEKFIQEIWGPDGRAAKENEASTREIVNQIRAVVDQIAQAKVFYLASTLLVPSSYARGRNQSLVLLLFALGMFSYGFQFELERGQSNIIAFSLALIALYLYHSRDDLDLLAYLLFSIGVQMKVYPVILIMLFVRDWRDWRGNVIRMAGIAAFNFALLFIMGFQMFSGFLSAVQGQQLLQSTWNGNHSLPGYVFNLAAGEYVFWRPRLLALFREYQAEVRLFFLALLGLALLSVFSIPILGAGRG